MLTRPGPQEEGSAGTTTRVGNGSEAQGAAGFEDVDGSVRGQVGGGIAIEVGAVAGGFGHQAVAEGTAGEGVVDGDGES